MRLTGSRLFDYDANSVLNALWQYPNIEREVARPKVERRSVSDFDPLVYAVEHQGSAYFPLRKRHATHLLSVVWASNVLGKIAQGLIERPPGNQVIWRWKTRFAFAAAKRVKYTLNLCGFQSAAE